MIELARRRAVGCDAAADFMVADAQTQSFEPGSFDMIVSRFGVMFFDDSGARIREPSARARPALRCAARSFAPRRKTLS